MDDRRRAPDRKSPVQPAKTGVAPIVILIVVGLGAVWTLRDTWVDSVGLPFSKPERQSDAPEAGSIPDTEAQSEADSVAGLFSGDDYPPEAQMNDEQGTVAAELTINEHGRVRNCEVVESSGSESLDSATCRILMERARFTPAKDSSGQPVTDKLTKRITWRLEG